MGKNYYTTLGVSKTATADEIKSSYRKLAIKYHPDKNPDDPTVAEKFMEINKAYETLFDPEKRKNYDLLQSLPQGTKQSFSFSFNSNKNNNKQQFDLASALKVFMQNMRNDSSIQNSFTQKSVKDISSEGTNIQITVALTLKEIYYGCKKTIRVKHAKVCRNCNGTGSILKQLSMITCPQCVGKGKVRVIGKADTMECNMCNGTGYIPENMCKDCSGSGRYDGETEIAVQIPKGISEGNYITIHGMGHAGLRGGKPGDLLIFIEDKGDDRFIRSGYDLETELTISMTEAVLGGSHNITDFTGDVLTFTVKPGTQPETLYRISGKGLPFYKQDKKGDLFVHIHVEIPIDLTGNAVELFIKFADEFTNSNDNEKSNRIGKYYIVKFKPEEKTSSYKSSFQEAETLLEAKVPIIFDMVDIDYFDSVGLGIMLKLHKSLMKYNEKLALMKISDELMEIMKCCNLDMIFDIFKDESCITDPENTNPEQEENEIQENNDYEVKEINGHRIFYAGSDKCSTTILEEKKGDDLLDQAGHSIGIDLQDVKIVDSVTLGSWIRYYNRAKKSGSQFFLLSPSKTVQHVLATTNLHTLFKIYDTEKELT